MRARELLLATDSPVEQIAGESGFLLTENMRTAFVNEFGYPPREYRQRFGTLGIVRPLQKSKILDAGCRGEP